MENQSEYTLINQQNGNLAFKLYKIEEYGFDNLVHRNNYFSLVWVTAGKGKVKTGNSEYDYKENTLLAFAPFQQFIFSSANLIKGIVIHFHSDFFLVHQHDKEMAFMEVLYNNSFSTPCVDIDENTSSAFKMICEQIKAEMKGVAIAQNELVVAYLKIFMINASRLKMEQLALRADPLEDKSEPHILSRLKEAIELNFRVKHSPGEYADLLFVTTKTLAKISKSHYNLTLSDIINDRIITEAKRELFQTKKAIKNIAYELGYEDEYYFSRFFKVNTNVSPQKYRETIGYERGYA
jgi:AraC family transcriptional regulator, transcriptional activator of pobA